jgi:hypothetical protein
MKYKTLYLCSIAALMLGTAKAGEVVGQTLDTALEVVSTKTDLPTGNDVQVSHATFSNDGTQIADAPVQILGAIESTGSISVNDSQSTLNVFEDKVAITPVAVALLPTGQEIEITVSEVNGRVVIE